MAEYNIISKSLWNSEKFKSLKNDQFTKLVYLYLLNSPHSNSCGCYSIHIGYIMADLNCSQKEVSDALDKLKMTYLIEYDFDENTVLITNFLNHNPPRNPKHAIKVFNDVLSVSSKKMQILRMQEFKRVLEEKKYTLDAEKTELMNKLSSTYTPSYQIPIPQNSPLNATQDNATQDNLTVKSPETKKNEKKLDPRDDPNSPKYDMMVYDGGVIKLRQKDFDAWLKRSGLDEKYFWDWLTNRDDWYQSDGQAHKKNWFISTSNAITKQFGETS